MRLIIVNVLLHDLTIERAPLKGWLDIPLLQKENAMGDDAEYYIEQQEKEARFEEACRLAAEEEHRRSLLRSLLCWVDGVGYEVWCWEPRIRVVGCFSHLHRNMNIGNGFFLASDIHAKADEELLLDEENDSLMCEQETSSFETEPSGVLRDLEEVPFYLAQCEEVARYEVITVSRKDIALLKAEAARQKDLAHNLKEQLLAEMIAEMASFIEQKAEAQSFVFAREI